MRADLWRMSSLGRSDEGVHVACVSDVDANASELVAVAPSLAKRARVGQETITRRQGIFFFAAGSVTMRRT
jgi:hypothetical protein